MGRRNKSRSSPANSVTEPILTQSEVTPVTTNHGRKKSRRADTRSNTSQSSTTRDTRRVTEENQSDHGGLEEYFQQLMEALYQNYLRRGGQQARNSHEFLHFLQQQQQEATNHPTSNRALRQIPTVKVTPEDLVDENNRQCCICIEE